MAAIHPVNTRRKLLIALSAAALTPSLAALAQPQDKVRRVGFLYCGSRQSSLETGGHAAFLQEMRDLGYTNGKNWVVEPRFADGINQRLPELARDLARSGVEVIVTTATPATLAAQQATKTIPIIMAGLDDQVGIVRVANFARSGGNITGLSSINVDFNAKRLDLLVVTVPDLSRVAALLNPVNPTFGPDREALQRAAQQAGVQLVPVEARTADEVERAFSVITQERAQALIVQTDPLFSENRRRISEFAASARLPAVFGSREYIEAGGLMSYGVNTEDMYRRAAIYVHKILGGAKPGNLPAGQPIKLEMNLNLKAATTLGINFPQAVMVLANKVVE